MQAYSRTNGGDWRRYAYFNAHHYVRNLVEGNDDFELIVSRATGLGARGMDGGGWPEAGRCVLRGWARWGCRGTLVVDQAPRRAAPCAQAELP